MSIDTFVGPRCRCSQGLHTPPHDISGVNFIAQAKEALPQGLPLLLIGDLNADLASPQDARLQEIAAEMATQGLMQGDIQSPTIFNIVTDAIVRHWLTLMVVNGMDAQEWLALFYADDETS
jgi:hypothetical protein